MKVLTVNGRQDTPKRDREKYNKELTTLGEPFKQCH